MDARPKRQIWAMLEEHATPPASRPSTATSSTESETTSPIRTRTRPDWDLQDDLQSLLQQAQEREERIKKWKATLQEGDEQLAAYKKQTVEMKKVARTVREVQRSLLGELGAMERKDSGLFGDL